MIRTQIYLEDADHRALRRVAEEQDLSMTEVVRRLVGDYLGGRRGVGSFSKESVLSFVAIGGSGRVDVSENHDDALDEAFRAGAIR